MKFKKTLLFSVLSGLVYASLAQASSYKDQANAFGQSAGFDQSSTVGGIIAILIQAILGILAIIFLIYLVYAGYLWMTASGNEDDVKKAKDIIRNCIIGLIIIIAAYSITYFVFSSLGNTGIGGGGLGETGGGGS